LLSITKVLLSCSCFHPLDNRWSYNCQDFGDVKPHVITVSKRLCPICWESLGILDEENQFGVCSHHSISYAVELPLWLPAEVVDALSSKFWALSVQELQLLLSHTKHLQSWAICQSQESESNISFASGYTSDHVRAQGMKQGSSSLWLFLKVRLFLHLLFFSSSIAWPHSEHVGPFHLAENRAESLWMLMVECWVESALGSSQRSGLASGKFLQLTAMALQIAWVDPLIPWTAGTQ
jgi:hypothetical protein